MSPEDLRALEQAVALLEHPSLAARLSNLVGRPIDWSIQQLPERARKAIATASHTAIFKALEAAVATMRPVASKDPLLMVHRAAALATGAAGGFFGLAGLAVELPISTVIMLCSIADIARSQGEDLSSPGGQLACIEVFALGGSLPEDDASESGYYASRLALATALTEAAEWIAERGLSTDGAPAIVRAVGAVASRFGIVVSHKTAAQMIPAVGALGGAAINYLFIQHFQSMAQGHFTVRRLERIYGSDEVRKEYERCAKKRCAKPLLPTLKAPSDGA